MTALLLAAPAFAAQTWRGKSLYFGDVHWHSCLSQDAKANIDSQYRSMLYDYYLDFSMTSEHAEAVTAGITECLPYLPKRVVTTPGGLTVALKYSGEQIATAMKDAADVWDGEQTPSPAHGTINFVAFPGYEWAPDARCWQASPLNPYPDDRNAEDNTPGHINYFFSDTQGWTYHDDVWGPGDGDSDTCAAYTALGITYYDGSKDWVDEILGQLIHQRDDPERAYDLMIQYNHPAASVDKGGSSDHLAKWYDFEHCDSEIEPCDGYCSVGVDGPPCTERHCEALRRAYGVTSVEWYTKHEAGIGATGDHPYSPDLVNVFCGADPRIIDPILCEIAETLFHDNYHVPERFVTSRGLREGYMLASTGGSDSHSGRRYDPESTESRGAGSASLTVVYGAAATRAGIWNGMTRRHTYALSRLREIGPVHKGRVDFYTADPGVLPPSGRVGAFAAGDIDDVPTGTEHVMGDLVEAAAVGTPRNFTIAAGAEVGTTGIYPKELRLYRVRPDTPLSTSTSFASPWLDDQPGDPGKLGELLAIAINTEASQSFTRTFADVVVFPGDAVFAIVPFSDDVWTDDFYDVNEDPLDTDGDHVPDTGVAAKTYNNDNTWARTTPIFFHAAQERPSVTSACTHIGFNGSGSVSPMARGAADGGLPGDDAVLPVAIPGHYGLEWNRWRFSLPAASQYVDLSFFNARDEDNKGHLFAVRIDGQLVYSGRAGIDHAADTLVDLKDISFPLAKGLHELQVHMDDQQRANGDNDPDFHCNDYDGPPAFLDAIGFHLEPGQPCGDRTPPEITCPSNINRECTAAGGTPATDAAIAAFLAGATATDDMDATPTITHDGPTFFPGGLTTVTFTAEDDAGNKATCQATVNIGDTRPPILAPFSLTPNKLAPPNHAMIRITVPTLVATDTCDASPKILCSVTSNEPPNGLGDGDQPNDIIFNGQVIATQGTGERQLTTAAGRGTFTLQLRSERGGKGKGRTYTASCVGADSSSNRSAARTATVTVPK